MLLASFLWALPTTEVYAMTPSQPTKSPRAKRVFWIGIALVLVLIALIVGPLMAIRERRQTLIDTQWSGTMFLDVYLRDQDVPQLLFSPGFQAATAEARLHDAENQYGKPRRSYHILEWHFGNAGGNQIADLYYEVDFKKTTEPLHLHFVHEGQDWKVADVVWRGPA